MMGLPAFRVGRVCARPGATSAGLTAAPAMAFKRCRLGRENGKLFIADGDLFRAAEYTRGACGGSRFFSCRDWPAPCYKPAARGCAGTLNDVCCALVAELVDALGLGSSVERCGGSSPSARTTRRLPPGKMCSSRHDEHGHCTGLFTLRQFAAS